MSVVHEFDLVLVGGGLQNGLIALGVLDRDPARSLAIVEAGDRLGGNHTWCAHPADVPPAARSWVAPLFEHRWPSYEVRFPDSRRQIEAEYGAITSSRFASVVVRALARSPRSAVILGRRAVEVGAELVRLDDGTVLRGTLVVDARGPDHASISACGFQKFLGLEVELERRHELATPILMDATVEQRDGFRFVYTLPFESDRLLVEDTCFSTSPVLDVEAARRSVLDYASRFGAVARVVREESAVLPMPWASRFAPPRDPPLVAGYRGGWFHPATGYSFPSALRLACHVRAKPPEEVFGPDLTRLHAAERSQARFAERLNRMLFGCFAPSDAWHVFARFYTLPEDLIHRFYAMRLTLMDRARILIGRPPQGFSLARALAAARTA